MLSRLTTITFQELRFVLPRLALYTSLVYATIRTSRAVANQASRLLGLENNRS